MESGPFFLRIARRGRRPARRARASWRTRECRLLRARKRRGKCSGQGRADQPCAVGAAWRQMSQTEKSWPGRRGGQRPVKVCASVAASLESAAGDRRVESLVQEFVDRAPACRPGRSARAEEQVAQSLVSSRPQGLLSALGLERARPPKGAALSAARRQRPCGGPSAPPG